uniref:Glucuronosyltransferase n=1 Tax=Panagrolaimus davidi TaxID=227884 RepID=A0A914Q211_9BILA
MPIFGDQWRNAIYQKQSKRMQKLVNTKPMNATQRLLSYTKFIGDNDGILPELSIVGSRLNLIVYYNIDVIMAVFIVVVIIPLVILAATVYFFRQYLNKPKENRQKRGGSISDKKTGRRY